ncbi:NAD(P)/FAD-dependent oxidoreductase [Streptomyces lonarensis]|uniref:FAD-binding oxidoreductase n=1 Tax=Streptomyces lonarensis TaxID=700599 RepID=A0A7X6CY09_9ACTN|nr:FAD-dependent oxidoreductase [Streptomyces lonarensis]NJQ04667.1 FAD-binding oxidoreductase [Streptomyces lonarensis]
MAETVVVGGGVIGAAIFHALATQGEEVTLVERHRPGLGASAWSGGIVRAFHHEPQLSDRAAQGWDYYREFTTHTGERASFTTSGFLSLVGPEQRAYARREAARIASRTPALWLEPDELAARFGTILSDAGGGGVWEPEAGYLDPMDVVRGWTRAGQRAGGTVLTGTRVLSLARTAGRVTGVLTPGGPLRADTVVLATGPATPNQLTSWGIRHHLWLQTIQVDLRLPSVPMADHPAFADHRHGTNGRPDPDSGGVFTGYPTGQRPQDEGCGDLDPACTARAGDAAARRFSWVAGSKPVGGLRAAECHAPSELGAVGPLADGPEGLLLATGFNGGGFKMAPWVASEVARQVTGPR